VEIVRAGGGGNLAPYTPPGERLLEHFHNLAAGTKTATKGRQFANPEDYGFVRELASVQRFFFFAQGILDRLRQALSRTLRTVDTIDYLLIDQPALAGVAVRTIRHYETLYVHCYPFGLFRKK